MCNHNDPDELHNWPKIMTWLREGRVDVEHIDQPKNKKRKTNEPSETDKMTNLRKVGFCAAAMSRFKFLLSLHVIQRGTDCVLAGIP